MPKRYHLYIFFIFLSLFLITVRCAVRKAPGGGPLDKTPPKVVFTLPASDSLEIPVDLKNINIVFSERMDQGSMTGNVFISPPIDFETEWENWEEVNFLLNEKLRDNQTYVISIASGNQDLQKNKMANSFQFAFSTGSFINRNGVEGRVVGLKKNESANIFAYYLNDTTAFQPTLEKPLYISKTGALGKYQLNYMEDGWYRILAVQDQNRNLLLDADFENVGFPFNDVQLDSAQSIYKNLDFKLTRIDTTAPDLVSIRPVNNRFLKVRLSEAVASSISESIVLKDSLSSDTLSMLSIGFNSEFENILDIYTPVQDSSKTYSVHIVAMQDTVGNPVDSIPVSYFHPIQKRDTSSFKLLSFTPEDSSKNISPSAFIQLKFSHPVEKKSLINNCRLLLSDKYPVLGKWDFPHPEIAEFRSNARLGPDSAYNVTLDMSSVQNVWGKVLADSVASHYFTIVSSRELGGVSGKVVFQDKTEYPVILNLLPMSKRNESYTMYLDGDDTFYLQSINEGSYMLYGFLDLNRDGRYSAGKLVPFQFSEPFRFGNDTIKVRKRWDTENLKFHIPVPGDKYGSADSVYKD